MISNQCILEIQELSYKAEALAKGSASDRKRADVILQRIGNLRSIGLSSDEIRAKYCAALNEDINPAPRVPEKRYQEALHRYLTSTHIDETELRDLTAGTQAISWTMGPQGGFTVPIDYEKKTFEAMAQMDPLLDPKVTGFVMEDSTTLQPKILQGFDLSTVQATLVGEAQQQGPQNFPNAAGKVLRGDRTYRLPFAASYEAEIDIPDFWAKLSRAMGVGFARRIGKDCVTGDGITQPTGLLTALPPTTGLTLNTGQGTGYVKMLTEIDLDKMYFSVDRAYRASPKCAWLMSDATYQLVRRSVDNMGRPLLDIKDDKEVIFGKPVYICPSLSVPPFGSPIVFNAYVVFGDLGHFSIRVSRPWVRRETQSSIADITRGQALFVGRIRADAQVFDPSNGAKPPIVVGTVIA